MPIYREGDTGGKPVFDGVVGITYSISRGIGAFLEKQYPTSEGILVAIVEKNWPNHIIYSTTGSPPIKKVLKGDQTRQPCPMTIAENTTLCEAVKIPVGEFTSTHMDKAVSAPIQIRQRMNFQRKDLFIWSLAGLHMHHSQIAYLIYLGLTGGF